MKLNAHSVTTALVTILFSSHQAFSSLPVEGRKLSTEEIAATLQNNYEFTEAALVDENNQVLCRTSLNGREDLVPKLAPTKSLENHADGINNTCSESQLNEMKKYSQLSYAHLRPKTAMGVYLVGIAVYGCIFGAATGAASQLFAEGVLENVDSKKSLGASALAGGMAGALNSPVWGPLGAFNLGIGTAFGLICGTAAGAAVHGAKVGVHYLMQPKKSK